MDEEKNKQSEVKFSNKNNTNENKNLHSIEITNQNKTQQITYTNPKNKSTNICNRLNYFFNKHPLNIQKNSHFFEKINQIAIEYLPEIYINLLLEELNSPNVFGYLNFQTDINEQMRAILVDWLTEVHTKFNMKEETLFLCVNILDRYLNKDYISRAKLQLVGVTSMLIACKQEEIYFPPIEDFVYITDNVYTADQILDMEKSILFALDFDI